VNRERIAIGQQNFRLKFFFALLKRKKSLFLLFSLVAFAFSFSIDYERLHYDALVVDTHNDVLQRIMEGEDIAIRTEKGHSDIPRLREGGVDVQVFSVWVPPEKIPHSYEYANAMLDSMESLVRRNLGAIAIARESREITSFIKQRKLVAILGMEGAHPLEDTLVNEKRELEKLHNFYERGIRSITLTWNNSVNWATSASFETDTTNRNARKGLTDFGKQIVRRMNELGMMVDISHVGEQTFWDVMRTTTKPVIASHSSVYNICPHRRNLKDEQLKAIAKNGGVVFINFNPGFIDSSYQRKEKMVRVNHQWEIDDITKNFSGNGFERDHKISELLNAEYEKIRPPLSVLIDHIDYVAKLIGVDHVGLGSDFDGINAVPQEMDDVTFLPNITRELLKRGYSEDDVKKILGGNFMRVFKEICG
jgi:membrane dipeptidase